LINAGILPQWKGGITMAARIIKKDLFWVGATDWDRRLFDELIPLPDGTSYNSYLVKGSEKTALIDTVDPTKGDELLGNLQNLDIKNIDYVIANHAEQDHSGALPRVLQVFQGAKVITNPKCKEMLMDLLPIPHDKFVTINDDDMLSLGNKTLQFIFAPWVHWPETMFTFLKEDKILFTCDFLGSHLATTDMFVTDEPTVYEAAKRYYAEIMMHFRTMFNKYIERINSLDVEMIAPGHGPIYDKPDFILSAYKEWISDRVKNEVVIPYISMHGSTRKMVDHLTDALIERGITVKRFDLTKTDIGKLAIALVDAATLIVASPTMLFGPHPNVIYATYIANILKPKLKFVSIIGSYGWGGKTVEHIKGMLTNLKVEIVEPVIVKGYPKENDLKSLDRLADEIQTRHNALLQRR